MDSNQLMINEKKKKFRLEKLLPMAQTLQQQSRMEEMAMDDLEAHMKHARKLQGVEELSGGAEDMHFELGDKTVTNTGIDPGLLVGMLAKKSLPGWVPVALSAAATAAGFLGYNYLNDSGAGPGAEYDYGVPALELESADEIIPPSNE